MSLGKGVGHLRQLVAVRRGYSLVPDVFVAFESPLDYQSTEKLGDRSVTEQATWDPLEAHVSDQEILSSAKKREIKNILKSYVGTYDPMSELIQNAMDAVERRLDQSEAGTYEPKIYIFIDLQENSFEVVDNGVGFRQAEFRAFMAPNISFKGGQKTRGNKGVGATYIAYGFNHLELRTKSPEFSFNGILKDGRKWVDDVQGAVTRPKVHEIGEISEIFESVDRGTSFKIRFGGPGTRPASLKWYGATSPGQWLYLLLLKTPLGHISLPGLGPAKIKFDVIVRSADGVCSRLDDQPAMYKWPHHEIHASRRIADIVKMQIEAAQKGKDPSTAVDKFRGSNGVYEIFNADDLDAMRNLSPEEKLLLKSVNLSAYGYFVYSTSVWDQLNDVKAKLRKSYRVLKGGLHLANNGMVQGDAITIPLTKSTGHQNQAHVVVHFEGADPDLGRKGFQPELRDLAEKVSVYVVGRLAARRDLLKSDSGAKPEIEKLKAVHEWIRDQEAHERENPLVYLMRISSCLLEGSP
ncbi:ATP-binding protein [Cereibacter sphaeroides]|uniref:ATP-binding protein n=1 Tax=Cereibacter sphaeroides TaxID=1063 RepID=UPI00196224E1|nr:ATP-binding protein [Cereibacter sphaeroides]